MKSGGIVGLWRAFVAVAWSFLGVRNSSQASDDLKKVSLFQFIGVGIALTLLFILVLVLVVKWVVAA